MKLRVEKLSTETTLLSFLREHLVGYPSVKAIKRAIDSGHCRVNEKIETFSTHKLKEGDEITIALPEKKEKIPVEILFEDDDLIAYAKPSGIDSTTFSPHLLVHRLDKGTSGVILFAKNQKTQEALSDLFREREIHKKYLALCDGKIEKEEWIVDCYLEKKAAYQGGALFGKAKKGEGKRAITHFRLLQKTEGTSLVEARPISGRTHQIRVHLQSFGHPVLGDLQYGRKTLHAPRLMLHALELSFCHPISGQEISLTAKVDKDFLQMQKTLFRA